VRLTAANTAIVLDSTADFPQGPERFSNWRIVPLYVNFGATSYRDYVDLGPDEFYARLPDASEQPTTSQPTPGDFLAVYEDLAGAYERIYSLQLSATLSGTFASAETAAASVGEAVRVVDTRTVSAAIAMLALAVQRRLEAGTTDEEIEALVERYRASHGLLFTVDTLEYLARGGRIGRGATFVGTLLNVKPILGLEHGEVVPLKRVRGSQKALEELRSIVSGATVDEPSLRIGLAHAAAPDRVAALEQIVR
jgi:DegV family protein with EDD domain